MMTIKTTQASSVQNQEAQLPLLPLPIDFETKQIFKKLQAASRALAELKGVALTIPNQNILISTLSLQEAKDSSAIENIITTQDELYRSDVKRGYFASTAAKEVHRYASALRSGFQSVKETGLLTNNHIQAIQAELEGNNAGFRSQAGTVLKNDQTNEVIYTPPQSYENILYYMKNLEGYINNPELCELDPLIKMAIIHHQFESIHPFFDGNGRTGRIINILYLVQNGLLDTPILYLSRYINQNKSDYYQLLQEVRMKERWEAWVLFMLEGVLQTAYHTIDMINAIRTLMQQQKNILRTNLPKIYSQDLLNHLFQHPYTKRIYLEEELNITRPTASKYLNQLLEINMISIHKIGKQNIYINNELFDLLYNVGAKSIKESIEGKF